MHHMDLEFYVPFTLVKKKKSLIVHTNHTEDNTSFT